MTLYLDVIWLLNFSVDLMLLWLTAFIVKRRVRVWRLIVGSLIGSIYIFYLFLPIAGVMYHPLIKFAYSVFIILSVFGYKRFYPFVQVVFMFYFVTFVLGGGMFALHYFMEGSRTILSGLATHLTPYGDVFSWALVLVGFPCLWLFSKQQVKDIKGKNIRYDQMAIVDIEIGSVFIRSRGFIDSGNHLHDPITKTPVMVLDMQAFGDRFPQVLVDQAKDPAEFLGEAEGLTTEWEARLRLIPFRGVGGAQQFLLAVKPDRVKIQYGDAIHECEKVFIGLNSGSLSAEGEFTCLIHPKLISESRSQSAS